MVNTVNTGITISTTDSLTSGQRIMIGEAMMANEPASPEPDLVSSEFLPAGSKQFDLLTYARLAQAIAVTEGTDASTVQQLFANVMSIDPTEHVVIVTLSKRAMRRQLENLMTQSGGQMGVAMRERQAKDVHPLYDGASKSVGAAATTLDMTHFNGAIAYLMTDNDTEFGPAPFPLRAVLHPEGVADIIHDLSLGVGVTRGTTGGTDDRTGGIEDGLSADLIRRWWRGSDRAYGVQIFTAPYLPRDSGDDYKGSIHAQEALFMVMEGDDDFGEESDNSARIVEFVLAKAWGEAERADPHHVEMFFDGKATV